MDIPNFTFSGQVFRSVRLLKVYDGDTVTVALPIGLESALARVNVRLSGIDACEIRGEDKVNGAVARMMLLQALKVPADPSEKYDEEFICDNDVRIDVHCLDFEKYGRMLAYVAPEGGDCVNDALCDGEFIVPYTP